MKLRESFIKRGGIIPSNVTIMPWFTFLLCDFIRPYQNFVYGKKRIESTLLINGRSAPYASKTNIEEYFLHDGKIYNDKMSEFGNLCNNRSKGLVIKRMEALYDHIYIDEVQDLAGYDLDLLEVLFKSKLKITLVGDNRQATFQTNNSPKNKKYLGAKIIDKFIECGKK